MFKPVLAIAGGVGGAKLALGLSRVLDKSELSIIVNTADDETFHGLHVSPDLDTVMYTLAGLSNIEQGWGLEGETFRFLESLERLGGDVWFRIGDSDLATHIRRKELLQNGYTLTEATKYLCKQLNIDTNIIPMSNDQIKTVAVTEEGELPFQDYFVRRRCEPKISAIRFEGSEIATPSPDFELALKNSGSIVLCPSNPLVSIGPVLAIPGVREKVRNFIGPRIAISPIVGGKAIKGPAAKMMAELGEEPSCVSVAQGYVGLIDALLIDHIDDQQAQKIADLGIKPVVTNTIMETLEDKVRLANEVSNLLENWYGD